MHSMLLSLSQFESFENRRSEVASSSIPLTEIGGYERRLEAFRLYVYIGFIFFSFILACWKRSSRVLSVSQRWVLGSGFTVLMGKWMFVRLFLSTCQHLPNTRKRTGRDVRKLEMEEPSCSTQKPQGNPNSHTHTHTHTPNHF